MSTVGNSSGRSKGNSYVGALKNGNTKSGKLIEPKLKKGVLKRPL